jgi:hypothetical protein
MPVKTITKTAVVCDKCQQEIIYGVQLIQGNLKITEYSQDSGHGPKVYVQDGGIQRFYHTECLANLAKGSL